MVIVGFLDQHMYRIVAGHKSYYYCVVKYYECYCNILIVKVVIMLGKTMIYKCQSLLHKEHAMLLLLHTCMHTTVYRHNDLPYQIRDIFDNQFDEFNLSKNGSTLPPEKVGNEWHTDIPRLRAGKVGAQVAKTAWDCKNQYFTRPV